MPKHRPRESIKSMFGSHIDPAKNKELKETKEDIDDKVKKIFNILKKDDGKEPLSNLIEDFHKHYHSLYARYDQLTGELRKKVQRKQGKETSSSSSDSDSDYEPSGKGSKNGKTNFDLEKLEDDFKKELETANLEVIDLKKKLSVADEEKEALDLEYRAVLDKLQAVENTVKGLDAESIRWNDEKLKLLAENEALNKKLGGAGEIEAALNQKLEDLKRENAKLASEKEAASVQVDERSKEADDLRAYTCELMNDREMLKLELEDVKKRLSMTLEKLEFSEKVIAEFRDMQKCAEVENSSLSSTVLKLSEEIKLSQEKMESLVAELNQVKEKLEEKEREILTHIEMHEVHKNLAAAHTRSLEMELDSLNNQRKEMEIHKEKLSDLLKELEEKEKVSSSQIEDLITQSKNMQQEIDLLTTLKLELQEQLSLKTNEASAWAKDLMDQINRLQQELKSHINYRVEVERQLEENAEEISEFSTQLEAVKEQLVKKSADHGRTMEEKDSLLLQVRNIGQEVSSLHDLKRVLEEQLQHKGEEITYLHGEMKSSQEKILEMEKTIIEKENEISILRKKFEDGEVEASAQITALTAQANHLQQDLSSLQAKKGESDTLIQSLTSKISECSNQIGRLQEELASKYMDKQGLIEEKDGLILRVKDLKIEVQYFHNKKSELEGKLSSEVDQNNRLREENEHLRSRLSELETALRDREEELFAVQKKMEDESTNASTEVIAMTEQVNDLRQERDSLESEKSKLEFQMERVKEEFSASLVEAKNQNTELVNQLANLGRQLNEKEEAFIKSREEHKQLDIWLQESKKNLEASDIKIKEMAEQFQRNCDDKDQNVEKLKELVKDLKGDLEMKGDEVSTLVENVRNHEVKVRLANQKLRITEQLLTENGENHKTKEERLLQDQKLLEERIATLSSLVAAYKEAQQKLINDVPGKVNKVVCAMDTFNMKFEEDYGHLDSRIYEILNELQVAMNCIKETNSERRKLKNEISILLHQLEVAKDQELTLKQKFLETERIAQKGEEEKERLVNNVKNLEGKVEQLSKAVKEKDDMMENLQQQMKGRDEGFLILGEEKREAIRQLCIWIEYHQSRYDSLKEMVLKTIAARSRIAA